MKLVHWKDYLRDLIVLAQQATTFSKSTIENLEKGVKYVQSYQ